MANIFISSTNRSRVYQLPFLPESMPDISLAAKNEEFDTYSNGTYNILGAAGLREISLEGILPSKSYRFAKSDIYGETIIELLENALRKKKPIRLILSGKVPVNMLVSVESFSWHEDKVGDIAYSVGFKEYRNV